MEKTVVIAVLKSQMFSPNFLRIQVSEHLEFQLTVKIK